MSRRTFCRAIISGRTVHRCVGARLFEKSWLPVYRARFDGVRFPVARLRATPAKKRPKMCAEVQKWTSRAKASPKKKVGRRANFCQNRAPRNLRAAINVLDGARRCTFFLSAHVFFVGDTFCLHTFLPKRKSCDNAYSSQRRNPEWCAAVSAPPRCRMCTLIKHSVAKAARRLCLCTSFSAIRAPPLVRNWCPGKRPAKYGQESS